MFVMDGQIIIGKMDMGPEVVVLVNQGIGGQIVSLNPRKSPNVMEMEQDMAMGNVCVMKDILANIVKKKMQLQNHVGWFFMEVLPVLCVK